MENMNSEEITEYGKDFELLKSFVSYNNRKCNEVFNSTDLRRFMFDQSGNSFITSDKTYDKGIRILKEKFSCDTIGKNPVFQKPSEYTIPLHTYVFNTRLASCLNINCSKLYTKQELPDDLRLSSKKIASLVNAENFSVPFSHTFVFDIHNYNMPPFFVPLFVGIVCSLTKNLPKIENVCCNKPKIKNVLNNFRTTVLSISESFYYTEHKNINRFLPEKKELLNLYTYWLELYFPDELFIFIEEQRNVIFSNNYTLSRNLIIIINKFAEEWFLNRIDQKSFLEQYQTLVTEYLRTPSFDTATNSLNNFDLIQKYDELIESYHIKEITFIKENIT